MQWLELVMQSGRWCKLPDTYEKVYSKTFTKLTIRLHPDKLTSQPDLARMAARILDKIKLCEHYLMINNRTRMQWQMTTFG